jgi:hypothetical protein
MLRDSLLLTPSSLPVFPLQVLNLLPYPEIISLVLNKVIPFFKFPDYITGTVNLANAGFKYEIVIHTCEAFSLKDGMESDVFIAEIPNDG